MRARFLASLCIVLSADAALADPVYTPANPQGQVEVILKDHKFAPSEIHVPANKRTELLVKNQDAAAEEFDSPALRVEKVLAPGKEGVIRLRELSPGSYPFAGEFNAATAKGVVIAE